MEPLTESVALDEGACGHHYTATQAGMKLVERYQEYQRLASLLSFNGSRDETVITHALVMLDLISVLSDRKCP
jgi:hypothetical protein